MILYIYTIDEHQVSRLQLTYNGKTCVINDFYDELTETYVFTQQENIIARKYYKDGRMLFFSAFDSEARAIDTWVFRIDKDSLRSTDVFVNNRHTTAFLYPAIKKYIACYWDADGPWINLYASARSYNKKGSVLKRKASDKNIEHLEPADYEDFDNDSARNKKVAQNILGLLRLK